SYDLKQTSTSGGVSAAVIGAGGSANLSMSQDKLHSNYDSVQEQTGIFAGKGGFDITVGEHTQLDGAVIASTATADKNTLDTGTLGFSNIDNKADFKTGHQGGSLSSGGPVGADLLSNLGSVALSGLGNDGHAEGTTQAAVSDGTITVRDTGKQQQNVDDLSRDTDHANGSINPIFDKEKEQNRLKESQLIGEIGGQVMDIARTQGDILGLKAALKANPTLQGDVKALRDTPEYRAEMQKYGTGSALQQGIQAATAAIQGLAGGNMAQALTGASAPYLAEVIKKSTGDNQAANAMAHAVLGAVTAYASGNSALAGAAGAATAELMAPTIIAAMGWDKSDLSEDQKQTVSTLATLAAGLAGGVTGNSSADAVAGALVGKNAVENNALAVPVPVSPPVASSQETVGAGCYGASVCVTTKPDGTTEDTPPITDGPSIVEARDEAAKSRDPNVAKDLTDEEKAELGGAGSGTPGGWEPQDEENARNNESIEQRNEQTSSENVPNSSEKLPWDSWQNYQKVTVDGRQYAQIGDRLYSQHAVDRMQPSSLGSPAGTIGPGRNITPNMVESVIKEGIPQNSVVNGVTRTTYWSGDVGVVTENNSNVIVTILRRSGQ
ncbi:VENN motif pre-toxin domain-containing protein, partial [Yersinia enterocolitica]|uniref:VENN motif pre-toxin domain-containing protein n=1 Tax=Yersinia enterocolitica TaxID=630 RepID=UPI003F458766